MGTAVLDGGEAWKALMTWLATPRIRLRAEPDGIEECLERWAGSLDLRGGAWTDAYLAAFAAQSGFRLVAFDAGFNRFPGLDFMHLKP